ncbi:MAG: inositol monophosphatase [Candidatus Sericytochromatia bacterium]
MISPEVLQTWLGTALEIVAEARQITLAKMAAGFETWTKPDTSYVTEADLAVEELLRSRLSARFPEHGILGEEFGATDPNAEFQWLIDPIDGTLSFTHGIPLFGTIVALHRQGQPLLGIIDHAGLQQCYWAAAGQGAFCNGVRFQIRDAAAVDFSREIISLCDRNQFIKAGKAEVFDQLVLAHPYTRIYSDCFGHTLAARGAIGAAVDYGLHAWDLAASQVLLEEAGGKYLELDMPGTHLSGVILGKPPVVDRIRALLGLEEA